MSTQLENITRVHNNIAPLIRAFFAARQHGDQFHMIELTRHVASQTSIAPGSPDRIMRAMRRSGVIDYAVVSRSRSLYRVVRLVAERQQELF